ncbi:MAG: glycosyltransferase [Lachnospiraceae bacterium]|nr:glycosyltransferase [Lachnospiraceae bacterium]
MTERKVLFFFSHMGTGGSQKIEAFAANALCRAGYHVHAINMSSDPCTVSLDPSIEITEVSYDHIRECQNPLHAFLKKTLYLKKLRNVIKNCAPDLIVAFLSDITRIVVLASHNLNIPIIGSERADPYQYTDKQLEKYRKAFGQCAAVVFQMPSVKEIYSLSLPSVQKVIPNPCIPRQGGFSQRTRTDSHVIIGAGRLVEQKRFDILIDAFSIVSAKHSEYRLNIYGDGPLRAPLQNQIRSLGLDDSVTLAGDVRDVFFKEKDAEMFVLSSDFEGLPNALIEAMATGIPCIATDCSPGGARFLLQDGSFGLIVPANNAAALAEAIMEYIDSPEIRESKGTAARDSVSEYDPAVIAAQWVDLTEEVLS